MEILVSLFTIVLVVAGLAFIFAGPQGAARVLGSPFATFSWLMRGILSATGRGLSRVIADSHRYFYRRWPERTVGFYLTVAAVLFLILFLTAGCGVSLDVRFQAERVSQGARTPPGEKVEKLEFFSGQTTVIGQGAWESGGVGGTFRGWEIKPSGKVGPVNKRVP